MAVWQGKVWANIMPEVYTQENKDYYLKTAARKVNDLFTSEEIMHWRKLYINHSARELYEQSDKRCKYSSFQRMLCGLAYNYLPYYHKKTGK